MKKFNIKEWQDKHLNEAGVAEGVNDNRMKVLNSATYKRMDGLHHVRNMKSAMNFLADIYHELEDEGFEPDEILEFFTMKMEQKLGGRTR